MKGDNLKLTSRVMCSDIYCEEYADMAVATENGPVLAVCLTHGSIDRILYGTGPSEREIVPHSDQDVFIFADVAAELDHIEYGNLAVLDARVGA